jgi:hypothetical protein
MGQQLRKPGRIPFIRLCARAAAPLMRIPDADLDCAREHVLDGLPVDTGAFHRDHRAVLFHEPGG